MSAYRDLIAMWRGRERQARTVNEWHRAYRGRLDIEMKAWRHERTLREIDANAAANRRLEEDATLAWLESDFVLERLARRRGKPVDLDLVRRREELLMASGKIDNPDPMVGAYQRHVDALIRQHRIVSSWDALPVNAYAWSTSHEIEAPPIRTAVGYLTVLHEIGHVLHPCAPTHVRVTSETGKRCCVRCEFSAWQYAVETALRFDREMHREAVRSLLTYRRFGTPAEQQEMDTWTGTRGYSRLKDRHVTARLRRTA